MKSWSNAESALAVRAQVESLNINNPKRCGLAAATYRTTYRQRLELNWTKIYEENMNRRFGECSPIRGVLESNPTRSQFEATTGPALAYTQSKQPSLDSSETVHTNWATLGRYRSVGRRTLIARAVWRGKMEKWNRTHWGKGEFEKSKRCDA